MQTDAQRFFEKLVDAKHRREDQSAEIARLRGALEQIATVCDDNAPKTCHHDMALKFVRNIATSTLAR